MNRTKIASRMCHTSVTKALVALGANLPSPCGDAETTIRAAIAALNDVTSQHVEASNLYKTPAFPRGSGPDYVNAAVAFPWAGSAAELLTLTQEIERRFGRVRSERWAARVLDLDILALGDAVLPNLEVEAVWRGLAPERARAETPDELILPHPRMAERAFVLVPVLDVWPDWRHPSLGRTAAELCAALPAEERAEITPL